MQTMQERITQAIEAAIVTSRREPVAEREWGNTGRIHAQTGFTSDLVISYDFQGGYCSIYAYGPLVDASGLTDTPSGYRVEADPSDRQRTRIAWHYLKYTDGGRVADMIATLRSLLDA